MPMFNPAHPGEILREYMGDAITVTALARHMGMPRENLSRILNGRLGISAAIAVKLSEAYPNSKPQFWLNLQNNYDLAHVLKQRRDRISPVLREAA
jgi:antitoxin HigA-1